MESQKVCPLLLAARLTSAGLAVAVLSRIRLRVVRLRA